MKAGDKVAYIKRLETWTEFDKRVSIKGRPEDGEVCTVLSTCSCLNCGGSGVFIKEYPVDEQLVCSWLNHVWRKIELRSHAISTAASRSLVKTFHVEKIGTRKDKYLPEERELVTDADF